MTAEKLKHRNKSKELWLSAPGRLQTLMEDQEELVWSLKVCKIRALGLLLEVLGHHSTYFGGPGSLE